MKTKKSQIIGQVFIYALVLIVVVLVAFLGYRGIQQIRNSAEDAQLIKFKTSITADANKMINDYGSVRTFSYNLPSTYYQICFVGEKTDIGNNYLLVQNIYNADKSINVYLLSREKYVLEKFSIVTLDTSTKLYCINITQGNFEVKMEGVGDKVKLIIPQQTTSALISNTE